jgi:hypothetical protein
LRYRLKDWALRMIYMLVAPEQELPWPTEFIQEDWYSSCRVIALAFFNAASLNVMH